MTDKLCENCADSDASARGAGKSCILLKCASKAVLKEAGSRKPISVLTARICHCDPQTSPHWKPRRPLSQNGDKP